MLGPKRLDKILSKFTSALTDLETLINYNSDELLALKDRTEVVEAEQKRAVVVIENLRKLLAM